VSAPSDRPLDDLPGYQIGPLLSAGSRFLVFRGVEQSSDRPVVLKTNRNPYPTDRDLAAQQRAYEIARELTGDVVVAHLALLRHGHARVLVTEDFGAESLDRYLREQGSPDTELALELAIALSDVLAGLHRQGVVHKDIKPSNILWNAQRKQLRLNDLELCSRLRQESVPLGTEQTLVGTLTYIAPEQTGRMNRSVDNRADLYAAGITLYELFAGAPPFVADDPKELIHAHLARPPPDLAALRPDLPASAVAIVSRLLEKNPEARYATAAGLAGDFRRVLSGLRGGDIAEFALGADDVWGRFTLPDRLYGREAETRVLLEALASAAGGRRRSLLVTGYSGVGKSALINEIQVPLVARHGWFCAGKFDQFRRDQPYLAWREVLASLTRQLLAQSEDHLSTLRTELDRQLAGNSGLIAELVPGLEVLFGSQKPPPSVGPAEAQARFDQAFRTFLRVLARPEHPLVLFVDDLQWADLASLQLFESLASDSSPAHLLVLGAYRDNEVSAGHPLTASLGRLETLGRRPAMLSLPPLSVGDVTAIVSDTLHLDAAAVAPLSQLVFEKTGGNPFFVRQFLSALEADGLIEFSPVDGRWRWDLAAIAQQSHTENVVAFMSARIRELAPETAHMLQRAACLGATFDLRALMRICDETGVQVVSELDQALDKGLLLPQGDDYRLALADARLAADSGRGSSVNPRYAFLHDRVQQSAHESIDPADRAAIHLRIARGIRSQFGSECSPQQALEVMEHLSESLVQLSDPEERLGFARLCLLAGQRAKAAMAIEPAVHYLDMGRTLLPADAWDRESGLALDLHLEGADACYISERYPEAEALAQRVLDRSDVLQKRVMAHNIRIGIGVAQSRYVEATLLGLDVLEQELGVRLPRRAGLPRVLLGILHTRIALGGRRPSDLLALPEMTDPRARAAVAILMKSATNAYWGSPNLVPLIAGQMVRLSLRQGNIGLSAYGYALFGMIITNTVDAVDAGYDLGRLAMELLERTGDRHLVGKTGLLWHGFIRHAKDPLRVCAADTLDCYDHALDAGDVENAVYCGTVAYYADLLAGRSLEWVQQRYRDHIPALLDSAQAQTTFTLKVWMQVAANLAADDKVESKTVGELIDWPAQLDQMIDDPAAYMGIATVAGGAGWLAFLLDDWAEAERQFQLLYDRADAVLGQPFWKPCMALYGITLSRKLARGQGGSPTRLRLARIQRWVRTWAWRNAHDYAAYMLSLAAERAARKGQRSRELAAWDDAAARAHEGGNLFLEAWATEQGAHAHGRAGHREQAHHLLDRAYTLWQRHGALARLRMLGAKQKAQLSDSSSAELSSMKFESVLEAVRAVSESIEVEYLVSRVLEISLLQAGGRRATLLVQDEALRPLATGVMDDQGRFERLAVVPSIEAEHLPTSLIDYISRTRLTLTVDNATTHEWLSRDPYVARFDRLSVIAAPLMRHGRLVGMVLLENDLGTGVFSESDAKVVETIAGQAAVSLENARLFEAQRRQAEAFGRFMPRPFLEQLGHKNVEDVRLGDGVQRPVTVMFTDLRGFTSLSERIGVHDNFALVNGFLARMTPVLKSEGGFIDEFTGDGFKALFIDRPDGALRAAVGMQHRLRRYNSERVGHGRQALAVGIGIHSGSVLLGTIGGAERMSTTVIGDTVNIASRLEGLTKAYGTPVLISEQLRAELVEPLAFAIRTVGRVRVKGRREAILVHELVDARPLEERTQLVPLVDRFNGALSDYFERRFESALQGFAACAAEAPTDPLAQEYQARAQTCLEQGVGPDWDGVIVREEK